jgi:hypothetical protein
LGWRRRADDVHTRREGLCGCSGAGYIDITRAAGDLGVYLTQALQGGFIQLGFYALSSLRSEDSVDVAQATQHLAWHTTSLWYLVPPHQKRKFYLLGSSQGFAIGYHFRRGPSQGKKIASSKLPRPQILILTLVPWRTAGPAERSSSFSLMKSMARQSKSPSPMIWSYVAAATFTGENPRELQRCTPQENSILKIENKF